MAESTRKKLAAIMFTRLVEYEKYLKDDKKLALDLLKEHETIISKDIDDFSGNIIKFMDDTMFAEFRSATDAVRCAISIHKNFQIINGENPDTFQMNMKIGIHMGEVYEKDGDLFGEGVNLAARVQQISSKGSTITTQAVYNSIRSEKDILTRDIGRVVLKNIKEPERLFKIYNDEIEFNKETPTELTDKLVESGVKLFDRSSEKEKIVPIAVTYLKNMGSSDDEFFCYGITEDLILDLSKVNRIKIPLLNKIIKYKDDDVDEIKIAKKLNVHYLIAGNIMKMGDNFRLSLQLIDGVKNKNIWTESWESNINEQGLRSKVVAKILESVNVEVPESLASSLKKDEAIVPEAYELFIKARYLSSKSTSRVDKDIVQDLYRKAIKIDNNYVEARYHYAIELFYDNNIERSIDILDDAYLIAKNNRDYSGMAGINNGYGLIYKNWGRYEQAIEKFEEALKQRTKEGNLKEEAKVLNGLGQTHNLLGNLDKAIEIYERALDINRKLDYKQGIATNLSNIAMHYRRTNDYAKAIEYIKDSIDSWTELGNLSSKARTMMNLGQFQVIIGHINDAYSNFNEAIKISDELNDLKNTGLCLRGLGLVELNQRNWSSAQDYFKKSLSIHQQAQYRPAFELTTLFLGIAYFYDDDFELAEKFINKSVQINSRRKNVSFYNNTALTVQVMLFAKISKAKESEVDDLLEQIELSKSEVQITREYWYLSQAYTFLGIEDKARECLKKSQITLEAISKFISDENYRNDYLTRPLIHQMINGEIKDLKKDIKEKDVIVNSKASESPETNKTIFSFCPNCGFNNSDKFKFCPQCGTPLSS